MSRRTSGPGRVTPPKSADPERREDELPSLRERSPFMFWGIVVGVLAMVLSTVSGFISLLG